MCVFTLALRIALLSASSGCAALGTRLVNFARTSDSGWVGGGCAGSAAVLIDQTQHRALKPAENA